MTVKFSADRSLAEEEVEIQRMIAEDPDDEESTEDQIAQRKPFREVFPEMAAAMEREIARRGRPPLENPKKAISIRLDQDVIEKFKATGAGWQSRINEVLKAAKV